MSITYGDLKTEISAAIRDPDGKTFDDTAVGRFVQIGLDEIGRILPEMFQEDITPTADTLSYVLRSADFDGVQVPSIQVMRVEIWDGSQSPAVRLMTVPPAHAEYSSDSEAGWVNWGGMLYLPYRYWARIATHEDDYIIRVWGYSPYVPPVLDDDVIAVAADAQWAIVAHSMSEALSRLLAQRDLYSQWQTRSGNTDVTPAGLMGMLNAARDDWRHRSRALQRLRSAV